MKLLGGCNESKYLNMAYDLKMARGEKYWFEGNATLCSRANSAIIVLRKRDVATRSVVPMFQDFCLPRPDRIVGITVSRNPNPDPDELKGEEEAKEYVSSIWTRHGFVLEHYCLDSNSIERREVPS
jgi:hypothetical protein